MLACVVTTRHGVPSLQGGLTPILSPAPPPSSPTSSITSAILLSLLCRHPSLVVLCATCSSVTCLLGSSSGRCLHRSSVTSAALSWRIARGSSPASCSTASVGVLLTTPVMARAASSWARSRCPRLVLDIHGAQAGLAYSARLRWVATYTSLRLFFDQPQVAPPIAFRMLVRSPILPATFLACGPKVSCLS